VRDAIAWAQFCAAAAELPVWHAYAHGAYLTLLDGLGLGLGLAEGEAAQLRAACVAFLHDQLPDDSRDALDAAAFRDIPSGLVGVSDDCSTVYGAPPFVIAKARAPPAGSPSPPLLPCWMRAMTSKRMSSN
jgi:midasin